MERQQTVFCAHEQKNIFKTITVGQSEVKYKADDKKNSKRCAVTSKIITVAGIWRVSTLCASIYCQQIYTCVSTPHIYVHKYYRPRLSHTVWLQACSLAWYCFTPCSVKVQRPSSWFSTLNTQTADAVHITCHLSTTTGAFPDQCLHTRLVTSQTAKSHENFLDTTVTSKFSQNP